MIQIQSTVEPKEKLSLEAWKAEFKVGLMAKPRSNYRDREMMELWKDKNGNIDYTYTIKKLKP